MPKKKDADDPNDRAGGPAADPLPEEVDRGHDVAEARRPPAHTVRLGRVKVTVWVNHTKADGKPYYGVTAARVYRTADQEWAQATSFDRGDLLPLAEALRLAFLWIVANPLTIGGAEDEVPF